MSNPALDNKDLLADVYSGLGVVLGITNPPPIPLPKLLGRHLTVFQIPSKSTPNYSHLVVGSKANGWRCSCTGFQAHGHCYHSRTVQQVMNGTATPTPSPRARRGAEARRERSERAGRRHAPAPTTRGRK